MMDAMDLLDMTIEDLVEDAECVNCLAPVGEFGHSVEGWGDLCEHCYEDMWDARMDLGYAYG